MNFEEIIGLSCTTFIASFLMGIIFSHFRHKKREKDIIFVQTISLKTKLLENGDLGWNSLNIEDLIPVNALTENEKGNIYGNLL